MTADSSPQCTGVGLLNHQIPKIADLPRGLISSDWKWRLPSGDESHRLKHGWRIGTDPQARQWLVKMKGSFYAYREHVFASVAQRLGISCQSSTYLVIDENSPVLRRPTGNAEPFQLALWFMDQHCADACSPACPCSVVIGRDQNFEAIVRAKNAGGADFDDMVRGDVLGHLCGQLEPHGHFFTRNHEYVIIDNECMFHDLPCLHMYSWLDVPGVRPVIIELCRKFVDLADNELCSITSVPNNYIVSNGRNLLEDLCAAKKAAGEYLELFDE